MIPNRILTILLIQAQPARAGQARKLLDNRLSIPCGRRLCDREKTAGPGYRERQVAAITATEYFQQSQQKARELRRALTPRGSAAKN